MMKITGLSHLFKWENLHNWWLTKYFFAPLYVILKASFYGKTLSTLITCMQFFSSVDSLMIFQMF